MLDTGESYRTVADIMGNIKTTLRLHQRSDENRNAQGNSRIGALVDYPLIMVS
jgi:hypothetical protein